MAFFKYGDKNIYYDEIGAGLPVVLLHGDTASSKMFEYIIPLYANSFKVRKEGTTISRSRGSPCAPDQ